MPFDFATPDGHDLAHAYATGQTDPVEAFEAALERLPVAEHAFTALTQGRGRREAEAARLRWLDHGPLSALDGVPIAWKDLFDMTGMVTTAGAAIRRHAETAPQDAALVSRLAQAGMVSLGKTNLSELATRGWA